MTDTITLPRSVVEQALDALSNTGTQRGKQPTQFHAEGLAIKALRAALEQPDMGNPVSAPAGWKLVPIKPTPVMVQAWLDAYEGNIQTVYRAMIAAAPQPPVVEQPQVEQEPVAYYVMNGSALFQLFRSKSQADALAYDLQKRHDLSGSLAHFHVVPLYTRPQPKRQPLTDERIYKMGLEHKRIAKDGAEWFDRESFARAIEAAHEIGVEA